MQPDDRYDERDELRYVGPDDRADDEAARYDARLDETAPESDSAA